jgi:hypothetical protein
VEQALHTEFGVGASPEWGRRIILIDFAAAEVVVNSGHGG